MEPDRRRALIVAHYHSQGRVRTDTRALLEAARPLFARVIVVSTNLNAVEQRRLAPDIETHVRPNVGYDFYSYRLGLAALAGGNSTPRQFDEVCLLNTSFLAVDGERFLSGLLTTPGTEDARGLTKSTEFREHLQSYALLFRRAVVADIEFGLWWQSMQPRNERQAVIANYELGLSQWLLRRGFRLGAAFDHGATPSPEIDRRSAGAPGEAARLNTQLNPSHLHWETLWRRYGFIKIELLKSNPFHVDLTPLVKEASGDPGLLGVIREGLAN